jgi:hypothetical protein
MYFPCRLPILGANKVAPDSLINISALESLVNCASETTRRPASPPSSRPSSTSTATPALVARAVCRRHCDAVRQYVLVSAAFIARAHLFQVLLIGIRVTRIHHNRIERRPALRKRQCSIDILLGRRVVKVNRNRDRRGVRKVDTEGEERLAAPI